MVNVVCALILGQAHHHDLNLKSAYLHVIADAATSVLATLASKFEVLPITNHNEFTNYANFALAASLSITLGLITWLVLWLAGRSGTPAAGV